MQRMSVAAVLLLLLATPACVDFAHDKALVKDGEAVKVIALRGSSPGSLEATVPVPGLIRTASLAPSTAFAINPDAVYVINTLTYETQTIAAPEHFEIRDIHVPANGVPYLLLKNVETGWLWPPRYERVMTLTSIQGVWGWGDTIEWYEFHPFNPIDPMRLVVAADGSQAGILAKDLTGLFLVYYNVPITAAFAVFESIISTNIAGNDLVLAPDGGYAYVAHDSGLAVYATGENASLVRNYDTAEIDNVKWGTGARKLAISTNNEFVYAATEGFLGVTGGGFALNAARLRAGEDLLPEDRTDIGTLTLPAGFAWLGDLFSSNLSFRGVGVAGNLAHFVLVSTSGLPGLPHALHLAVNGKRFAGLSLLDRTPLSTPVDLAVSTQDSLVVTDSDGGYLNRILAVPPLGFLPGEVAMLANEALDNPTSMSLSKR